MSSNHFCPYFQTLETIDKMREGLNASRPQCPVGLTTLRFPSQLEVRLLLKLFSFTVKTFETNQHSLKSHAKGEHCRLDHPVNLKDSSIQYPMKPRETVRKQAANFLLQSGMVTKMELYY